MIGNGARFSPCRSYRYSLWRDGLGPSGMKRHAMFVGLNPSTADETNNDPTVRRCIAFARAWGYGALCMTNLFAFRATKPSDMKRVDDPVGPDNDQALVELAQSAGIVVAAWGTHGSWMGRDRAVRALISNWHCLRLTRDGHPSHPLYLPGSLLPVPWPPAMNPAGVVDEPGLAAGAGAHSWVAPDRID